MKKMRTVLSPVESTKHLSRRAFTLVELVVVLALAGLGGLLLVPVLAQSRTDSTALRCMENHRRMVLAWQMYAADFRDVVPAASSGLAGRPLWMTGSMDFTAGNPANYNTNQDIVKSPLWPYMGNAAALVHCPSDTSFISLGGQTYPRVRTLSMNSAFGSGAWLNGAGSPGPYRIYASMTDVRLPAHTFVFIDEHPDSINDASLLVSCAGAQPGDSPGVAKIIDFPASLHNGAATVSFVDGHVEVHTWIGRRIAGPLIYSNSGFLPLNTSAGDSWVDMHWLAANTTVEE